MACFEVDESRGKVILSDLLILAQEALSQATSQKWKRTRRNGEVVIIRDAVNKLIECIRRSDDSSASQRNTNNVYITGFWVAVYDIIQVEKNPKSYLLRITLMIGK